MQNIIEESQNNGYSKKYIKRWKKEEMKDSRVLGVPEKISKITAAHGIMTYSRNIIRKLYVM